MGEQDLSQSTLKQDLLNIDRIRDNVYSHNGIPYTITERAICVSPRSPGGFEILKIHYEGQNEEEDNSGILFLGEVQHDPLISTPPERVLGRNLPVVAGLLGIDITDKEHYKRLQEELS